MSENPPPRSPPSYPPRGASMDPADERMWATFAHAGSFLLAWIALGVLAPLIVLVVYGERSAYVRHHAVESLNFQITMLITIAVSAVLVIFVIGLVLLPLAGLVYLVMVIVASFRAYRGELFTYPLTLRLVH